MGSPFRVDSLLRSLEATDPADEIGLPLHPEIVARASLPYRPTYPIGGTGGGLSSGFTHDDRSKIMNSSASSCGVSAVVTQPVGNGTLPESDGVPGRDVEIAHDDAAALLVLGRPRRAC